MCNKIFFMILSSEPIIAPKSDAKSRFHAGFSHKSPPEIAYNSCSRQVYPITLDATLYSRNHANFPSNSRFHALKYVGSLHHAFSLGAPFRDRFRIEVRRNTNVPDYSSVVWCSAAPKVHKHHQLAEPLLNQDLQVKGDIV